MVLIINNLYNIGQEVYLKTDSDQLPHMVTSIKIFARRSVIVYGLTLCKSYSEHYECELHHEKVIIL